jgi:hypothetical protein
MTENLLVLFFEELFKHLEEKHSYRLKVDRTYDNRHANGRWTDTTFREIEIGDRVRYRYPSYICWHKIGRIIEKDCLTYSGWHDCYGYVKGAHQKTKRWNDNRQWQRIKRKNVERN